MIVGALLKRSSLFPDSASDVLNIFILNVSLPAIIFENLPSATISYELLLPVIVHYGLLIIHIPLVIGLCRLFKIKRSIEGALILVTTMGNTAFLGITYVGSLFGSSMVPYAVIYDILGTGIVYILYMAFQVPRYTGESKKDWKFVFLNVVKFPPFIALALGFLMLFLGADHHPYIKKLLSSLSATLVPLAMISVGFSMKLKIPKDHISPFVIGLGLKLLLIPFLGYLGFQLLGNYGEVEKVTILQAGMPPLITGAALAAVVDLEKEFSMTIVGFGLLLSFITLPLWV
jgi:predicted permease